MRFIAIEGMDGTGKSTQVRMLVDELRARNIRVRSCIDPGGTEIGREIRKLLLHTRDDSMGMRTEAMLYMSSRAELVHRHIKPAFENNTLVVSDRFTWSTLAYQGYAGGLDIEDLRRINTFVTDDVTPDLTFLLDMPVAAARARLAGTPDRLERRSDEFFEKIRQGFLTEAANAPLRQAVVLDATAKLERVHAAILHTVLQRLEKA